MRDVLPNTSNEAIGERLSAAREARGLSQAELSGVLGISPQRWGTYERGRSVPPPDVLAKFWQLTGATSDFVLFGSMAGMPMELVTLLQRQPALEKTRGRKPAAG